MRRSMSPRRKLLWFTVAAAGALLIVSAADPKGFRRYYKLKAEIDGLAERNAALVERNRTLVGELEAIRKSPRALERAAREELGYVKPGEIVINLEAP